MTYTKKRVLPALHQSGKVSKPDLQSIGDSNYTDTILRYNNLAVKFPQLETEAKTIVEAINELYRRPGGEAELFYYSYTNSQDIIIRPTSPTPVGGVIETESGETLETESGETLETEQFAGDNSNSSSTSNDDDGEVEIASITFEYKKKTSVKIETEFNMLAYPSSSAWGTNSGAFWYQLYYYCDDELISYTPYETISYWISSSDDRVCKICRDFFYHLEEIESGEHIFKITVKVGGLDYAKIPAKNCNVILNDLGTLLNPAPIPPEDIEIKLSENIPIYSYGKMNFVSLTDSYTHTSSKDDFPGMLLANWDFTGTGAISARSRDTILGLQATVPSGTVWGANSGINIRSNSQNIVLSTTSVPIRPRKLYNLGSVWDIKLGDMDAKFTSSHGVIFGLYTWYWNAGVKGNAANAGFMWHRQTGRFAIWDSETLWQDSDITDKNYFANSTLRIYIDKSNKWHIYKDGVLVFEPPLAMGEHNSPSYISTYGIGKMIDGGNTSFYNMDVKGVRVWHYDN